jgi:hypothetical protein
MTDCASAHDHGRWRYRSADDRGRNNAAVSALLPFSSYCSERLNRAAGITANRWRIAGVGAKLDRPGEAQTVPPLWDGKVDAATAKG